MYPEATLTPNKALFSGVGSFKVITLVRSGPKKTKTRPVLTPTISFENALIIASSKPSANIASGFISAISSIVSLVFSIR